MLKQLFQLIGVQRFVSAQEQAMIFHGQACKWQSAVVDDETTRQRQRVQDRRAEYMLSGF
ncbi:hypothetical protein [Chitinimonas naiadis]